MGGIFIWWELLSLFASIAFYFQLLSVEKAIFSLIKFLKFLIELIFTHHKHYIIPYISASFINRWHLNSKLKTVHVWIKLLYLIGTITSILSYFPPMKQAAV